MNILLVLSIMVMVLAITPKTQADLLTGFYKVSTIEESTDTDPDGTVYNYADGIPGRVKVFVNSAGKLRFSGWITEYEWNGSDYGKVRKKVLGAVNPTTGRIRVTKIGENRVLDLAVSENFVLNVRIIKRNDVVVGVTGSGSASGSDEYGDFSETFDVTGYKTRDLPE